MQKYKNLLIRKFEAISDARAIGLLAFGVVALLVTWSGIKVVQTNYELEKKISVAKQRNDIEQLQNENMKLQNKYYESDQYLELAARRQFGKALPGERLYTVPDSVALANSSDTGSQATSPTQTTEADQSKKAKPLQNFDDWMKFLFH